MEKKKIITLGIAGLSFILAASITSTVAWYTGSSYLAITDLNVSLKDPRLEISLTGNENDFADEIAVENSMTDFSPVTSAFSNEWIERKEEKPVFKDGYAVGSDYLFNKSSDFKTATTGYFSKAFYLRCDIDANITFDPEGTYFEPDTNLNHSPKLNDVVKSMRFSVLVLGENYKYTIYDPNKTEETYLGGILDTANSGYYNTYANKEILYGQIYSSDPNKTTKECIVYDEPLAHETNDIPRNEMTCFKANNAQGDRKFNRELSEANGLVIQKENSLGPDEVERKFNIPLKAGRPQKIILSFYQEGWDLDNTNFIVHSNFLVYVSFMIAPTNPY